jgi:hypothetical protein
MGLTRIKAKQISNLDYKQAARVVTTTNVTLSGGAPTVVDGVSLVTNNRVLVAGQSNKVQNGIYRVATLGTGANGTWVRTIDADTTGEMQPGMIIMVTEGDEYADRPWKLVTNGAIVVGETELDFQIFETGGGGGTPGGSDSAIQFNSLGTFAGTANLAWTGTELSIAGNIIPQANIVYDLGNSTNRWNDIWLANSSIYLGNAVISANATSLVFTNPEGAQVALSGSVSDISANTVTVTGNVTGGNLVSMDTVSATGNIDCGNLTAAGTVTAANIDSVNADIAEKYLADAAYQPGTVVEIGGAAEITMTVELASTRVVGVVSTAPAVIMNSTATGSHVVAVALLGRAPCRVIGPVRRGDLMISSDIPGVAKALLAEQYQPGAVIGKALQENTGSHETVIEILVGKI